MLKFDVWSGPSRELFIMALSLQQLLGCSFVKDYWLSLDYWLHPCSDRCFIKETTTCLNFDLCYENKNSSRMYLPLKAMTTSISTNDLAVDISVYAGYRWQTSLISEPNEILRIKDFRQLVFHVILQRYETF